MKILLNGKQIWTVPIMLGLISACGLVAALLFDGIGDVVSWIALAVPALTGLWCLVRSA
ncbi:hypothetical protein [Methylobacter sp.]|uniref:hypothetical protein n=1 Tax=Methylobacter sp. TaxID=2051955 RepID=UPI002FDCB556